MIYSYEITVPAGTTTAAPLVTELKLTKGVVHRFSLRFYPGPAREVYVSIRQGVHQVWPTNPEGVFRGDDDRLDFDEYLELSASANTLKMYTWSPSATYDHAIALRIGLIENEAGLFILKVLGGLQKFLQLMRVPV